MLCVSFKMMKRIGRWKPEVWVGFTRIPFLRSPQHLHKILLRVYSAVGMSIMSIFLILTRVYVAEALHCHWGISVICFPRQWTRSHLFGNVPGFYKSTSSGLLCSPSHMSS